MTIELQQDLQYSVFGPEGAVYPGHCVTLAYLILHAFPSLEAAKHRSKGASCPDALSDSRIPGAGGPVYAALRVLELAFEHGVDAALEYGDEIWRQETSSGYQNRREPGQLQADGIKADFRERFNAWAQFETVAA